LFLLTGPLDLLFERIQVDVNGIKLRRRDGKAARMRNADALPVLLGKEYFPVLETVVYIALVGAYN
jgi:hypothetical protein